MPAVYAHDRFGKIVSGQIHGTLHDLIQTYYTQFEIGLQGPDIFFFYLFNTPNCIVKYGNHLHHISAMPFFRRAVRVIRKKGRDSREYAYLLGFLCHFTLDSECHPYVREMIGVTGAQHLEVEEEFEKLLLRMDQEDPFSYPMGDLIPTDEDTVQAILPFYRTDPDSPITRKIVRVSLQDMKTIKRFFTAPQSWKYHTINTLMKMTGKYPYLKGLMHQRIDNPCCSVSNDGLMQRFDDAVPIAVHLMEQIDTCIRTGSELPERFDRTFE